MPITDTKTKMNRMAMLQRFARSRPEGFRTKEAAAHLGVTERTVRRYLREMSEDGRLPVHPEGRIWKLTKGGCIPLLPIHLDLHEALALYLATRLFSQHSDKHNPHAVAALKKLASEASPLMGDHIRKTAAAVDGRRKDERHQSILETLTEAWERQRQVRIEYRAPGKKETTRRTVDPYFIEPSAVGYACYLIGYDHLREALRVFKVERIRRAALLDTSYEIRGDFNPYEYLENAWGVMGGTEITEVRLRFSSGVAYRVRESDWPGVVRVEEAPDGGCVATFRVSHTLEMKPWIRGWGPDCEVLAPEKLRAEIAGDMRKAATNYAKKTVDF